MKSRRFQKIISNVQIVISMMLVVLCIAYFSQHLCKKYYFSKLWSLNVSLKNALEHRSPAEKLLITRAALPLLNSVKIRFLKYVGYWPDIYNGYNQIAFIENLNNDKKGAVRYLLRSLHYHPNLTETYRALSIYLKEAGFQKGARRCRKYHNSLMEGGPINRADQKKCIDTAIKFLEL